MPDTWILEEEYKCTSIDEYSTARGEGYTYEAALDDLRGREDIGCNAVIGARVEATRNLQIVARPDPPPPPPPPGTATPVTGGIWRYPPFGVTSFGNFLWVIEANSLWRANPGV